MKVVLSAFNLSEDLKDLKNEMDGIFISKLDEQVRPCVDRNRCFPTDGYRTWQQRWLMGTGVRPKDL